MGRSSAARKSETRDAASKLAQQRLSKPKQNAMKAL